MGESRWRIVMRFKMDNEIRDARYWKVDEKRGVGCFSIVRRHGSMCYGSVGLERKERVGGKE